MIHVREEFLNFLFYVKKMQSLRNSSRKFIDRKIFSEKSSAKKNVNWTSNALCYIERVATCMKDKRERERERERGTISDTVCYSINSVRLKSAAVTGSLCRVVAISRLFFVREKQVRRHGIDRSFDISRTSSLGHRVEWGSSMNAPFSRIYWRARVPIFPFRDVTKLSQYDQTIMSIDIKNN